MVDGARALAVVKDLGVDQGKIVAVANATRITDAMKAHARLGAELKLVATPSYVIAGAAILGHPGLKSLRKVVRAVRACGKVAC